MQQTIQIGQVQPSVLPRVESFVKSLRENVAAWTRNHREQLECYVGGPLIVAFCAAMCYLAAVLQGGVL